MGSREAGTAVRGGINTRKSMWITIISDLLLIGALVVTLLAYAAQNKDEAFERNVGSIQSIAAAKSEMMSVALANVSREVKSAYRYCDGLSLDDMLAYLHLISGEGDEYILLKRDEKASTPIYHVYEGFSTVTNNGEYTPVRYENTNLPISLYLYAALENGEVSFSQSFTNKTDALPYFAVFCGITAIKDGVSERYFLVKPQKESKVLDQLQMVTQYDELSTAICYADGRYLARDVGFRAQNFFDYLYDFNGLTMDERNAIRDAVRDNQAGFGSMVYLDYKNRECVFAYSSHGDSQRYVVVCVPTSQFVQDNLLTFFPLVIIAFLGFLLVFNLARLLALVRALSVSVERERVANLSKSSFLSRMSHEIRTPLNAVIGYNAIARNDLLDAKDDAQRRQIQMKVMGCLVKSDIASRHLLAILNDVLDMSAIESGKMKVSHERFDFKTMITSLTTVFYSQARAKGVELEVVFGTLTEEWFIGDQMRTNQILTNLLSNAIKFTLEGGSVRMVISQPEADTNAQHIRFVISDTGIGMTKEYLEHIWTPFEQADASISRRFGGTGLGLSITKNLIALMGGTIAVESEPGVGTTFTVELSFEKAEQPINSEPYNFSQVRALVVDDDASTCDYIRMLFSRLSAQCVAVTSGKAALDAIQAAIDEQSAFTVGLVDWQMPGMNGLETIRRIRAMIGMEMPIIVISAYDYTEIVDKAKEIGVSRFISKPLFQSSLVELLSSIAKNQVMEPFEKTGGVDFAGARLLLAEDNAMNMEIAKAILTSAGLTVDTVWNGSEAVERFTGSPPGAYMAILMDIHMPVMNGHEAARAIRTSDHPEAATIPIIAMTADAFAENVAEARESGMNDHIAKPIDITALFDTLSKYKPKG